MKIGDKIAIGLGVVAIASIVIYLKKSGKINIELIPTQGGGTQGGGDTQGGGGQGGKQGQGKDINTGTGAPAPSRPSKDSTASPISTKPLPNNNPNRNKPEYNTKNQYPQYPQYNNPQYHDYYYASYDAVDSGGYYGYSVGGSGYDFFKRKQMIYGYGGDPSGYGY